MEGREDTVSGGTAWERIGRLVDLTKKGSVQQQSVTGSGSGSGAGSGKEKFREVLISLRKDESAPGAKGI